MMVSKVCSIIIGMCVSMCMIWFIMVAWPGVRLSVQSVGAISAINRGFNSIISNGLAKI